MKRALTAGTRYFAVVFAAGFALGVVRALWLAPWLGPTPAVAIELPVMLAVSWIACARSLRRLPLRLAEAAAMGGSAFALLMATEAGLSLLLAGRSLWQHLALYAELPHQLGLAGQLAFACLPLVQAWRTAHARRRGSDAHLSRSR